MLLFEKKIKWKYFYEAKGNNLNIITIFEKKDIPFVENCWVTKSASVLMCISISKKKINLETLYFLSKLIFFIFNDSTLKTSLISS